MIKLFKSISNNAFAFMIICANSVLAAGREPLDKINVYGNHALDDSAIIKLSGLEDEPALLSKEVEDRLLDSGLFSRVRVERKQHSLSVTVLEKTMWFAFPYLSLDEESLLLGVAGGKAALMGQNAQLLGRIQTGRGSKIGSVLVKDDYFLDSDFLLGASLDYENAKQRVFEGRSVVKRTENFNLGGSLQTGYHADPLVFIGFNTYIEEHKFQTLSLREEAGLQLSHRIYVDYGRVYKNEGLIHGKYSRFYLEKTNPLGDFSFTKFGVSGLMSPVLIGDFNWTIKPKLEWGSGLPYFQRFELGGSKLRSFPNEQFRDDRYLSLQNDLLLAAAQGWGIKLRPLLYLDWGFIERSGRLGFGTGVQAFLPRVAMPAVQIFAGYGLNPPGFSASAAVGPQF